MGIALHLNGNPSLRVHKEVGRMVVRFLVVRTVGTQKGRLAIMMMSLSAIRRVILSKDNLIRDQGLRLNLLQLNHPMGSMSSAPPQAQGTARTQTMEVGSIEDTNLVEIGAQHHKKISSNIILPQTESGRGRTHTLSTSLWDHITTITPEDRMTLGLRKIINLNLGDRGSEREEIITPGVVGVTFMGLKAGIPLMPAINQ